MKRTPDELVRIIQEHENDPEFQQEVKKTVEFFRNDPGWLEHIRQCLAEIKAAPTEDAKVAKLAKIVLEFIDLGNREPS